MNPSSLEAIRSKIIGDAPLLSITKSVDLYIKIHKEVQKPYAKNDNGQISSYSVDDLALAYLKRYHWHKRNSFKKKHLGQHQLKVKFGPHY